jgi:hypothetical protein
MIEVYFWQFRKIKKTDVLIVEPAEIKPFAIFAVLVGRGLEKKGMFA